MEQVEHTITYDLITFTEGMYAGHRYLDRRDSANGVVWSLANANVVNMPAPWERELELAGLCLADMVA